MTVEIQFAGEWSWSGDRVTQWRCDGAACCSSIMPAVRFVAACCVAEDHCVIGFCGTLLLVSQPSGT